MVSLFTGISGKMELSEICFLNRSLQQEHLDTNCFSSSCAEGVELNSVDDLATMD